MTSSYAAIGYGHGKNQAKLFDETDWSDLAGPGMTAYAKSKTHMRSGRHGTLSRGKEARLKFWRW